MIPKVLNRICNICHSKELNDYQINYRSSLEILKCLNCDLTFVNEKIESPSQTDSSVEHFLKSGDIRTRKAKRDLKDLISRLNESIFFDNKIEIKILDVGCGLGYFLLEARQHGWIPYGLEINRRAAIYAQQHYQLDVKVGNIEQGSEFPSEYFDVITMFGVIEHLITPSEAIKECYSLLKSKGILYIQTPTEDGLFRKAGHALYRMSFGKINFHIKELYSLNGGHNLCFSRKSIKILLEKYGFRVERITGTTYGLKILLRRFRPTIGGIAEELGTSALYLLAKVVRKLNHMTVLARKK